MKSFWLKKAAMLGLALVMICLLCACGGTASPAPAAQTEAPAAQTEAPAETAAEPEAAPTTDFPTGTITIVVPHGAGGGVDTAARTVAPFLAKELGVNVVIENIKGGNGITGHVDVLNRHDGGYSLVASTCASYILAPYMYGNPYDPMTDFVAVGSIGNSNMFLAAGPSAPVKTLDEFISYAAEHPGELTIACAGLGDISGLSLARFLKVMGIEANIVPYDSAAESSAALAGGHVMYSSGTYSGLKGFVDEGTVTVLLDLTGGVENPPYEVPCVSDVTGNTADETHYYKTLVVPADTPDEVVAILRAAWERAILSEECQAAFQELGDPLQGVMNGEVMQQQVLSDGPVYSMLVEELGLAE